MTGTRAAVALYVAIALHAVALLFLLLAPVPQTGAGDGIGLTLLGSGTVLAATGVPSVVPARSPAAASAHVDGPARPLPPSSRTSSGLRAGRSPDEVRGFSIAGPADEPADRASREDSDAASAAVVAPHPGHEASGAMPGNAGGGGVDSYFARVRTHLAAYRRTVADAASGRAEVRFTVLADGRVADVVLERSSGSGSLDAEALALIARAQPLPLPPRGEPLRVQVPVYVGG